MIQHGNIIPTNIDLPPATIVPTTAPTFASINPFILPSNIPIFAPPLPSLTIPHNSSTNVHILPPLPELKFSPNSSTNTIHPNLPPKPEPVTTTYKDCNITYNTYNAPIQNIAPKSYFDDQDDSIFNSLFDKYESKKIKKKKLRSRSPSQSPEPVKKKKKTFRRFTQ
jgi:hypothetical protein